MNCPSCASELPSPKFKFCPFCGAATASAPVKSGRAATSAAVPKVSAPAAAAAAPDPRTLRGAPIVVAAKKNPATADTIADPLPAIVVPAAKVESRRRPLDTEAATVFELPAVNAAMIQDALAKKHESHRNMEPALTTGEIARAKPTRTPRKAKTDEQATAVNISAVTDDALKATPAPSSPPVTLSARPAADAPRVAEPGPAAAPSGRKKFSETAWFLAAVNPDQLADGEGVGHEYSDPDELARRYAAVDADVPDDVRRGYSLSDEKRPKRKK